MTNNKTSRPALPHLRPDIRLIGSVDEQLVHGFLEQSGKLQGDGPVVIELTSIGGEADTARRLAQDIRMLARQREVFILGKSYVYSAGITALAAVPASHRFLTPDTVLLVHERRMDRTVQLCGALRSGLAVLHDLLAELEIGRTLERQGFDELAAGSSLTGAQLQERVQEKDWYLMAAEAVQLGLVAGLAG
jgi:ATP-dependent protease ClpP protease subunit